MSAMLVAEIQQYHIAGMQRCNSNGLDNVIYDNAHPTIAIMSSIASGEEKVTPGRPDT